ncbi:MAG: hypothetical protein IJ568_02955 [Bacilli bacterium]|nr:hypothetical protein [Bacilli bacterium]
MNDLILIKKKYGEEMMHLCRELFPTILINDGALFEILSNNFAFSHILASDIKKYSKENDFSHYINYLYYKVAKNEDNYFDFVTKSPKELLKSCKYTLFECLSNEDIQKFRKYYKEDEELCTFRENRIKKCYVFFAVKENADLLNRLDFTNPQRDDEYGTSVISIQFTKGDVNIISIKNRYNHAVDNCDATFDNNLDNIVPGLTKSFEKFYNLNIKQVNDSFTLLNYVKACDSKMYAYNYFYRDIYYCPNNICIKKGNPIVLDKSRYIVFDNYILDLKEKKIIGNDSFTSLNQINSNEKISIINEKNNNIIMKTIKIGEDIVIKLDDHNRMICYSNERDIDVIPNDFLSNNIYLKELNIPKVKKIGGNFLNSNLFLEKINIKNIEEIGDWSLSHNRYLEELELPKIKKIPFFFLNNNKKLYSLKLDSVKVIDDYVLVSNEDLKKFYAPNLEDIGIYFLESNNLIKRLNLPKVRIIGDSFLSMNKSLEVADLPYLEEVGNDFLHNNEDMCFINAPKVRKIGRNVLNKNLNMLQNLYYIKDNNIENEKERRLILKL